MGKVVDGVQEPPKKFVIWSKEKWSICYNIITQMQGVYI